MIVFTYTVSDNVNSRTINERQDIEIWHDLDNVMAEITQGGMHL